MLSNLVTSFVALAAVFQSADPQPPRPKSPELRTEILRRKEVDQTARMALIEAMNKPGNDPAKPMFDSALLEKMTSIDDDNTKWLKKTIAEHGWPGKTLVGEDGAAAAWLLVQHADRDRAFQKECLALMKAMPAGEVRGENIAYLEDRVLTGDGKPQRYGTQTREIDGKFVPLPIEDEATVDERRKQLGMLPLADYLKQVEAMYRPRTEMK